MSEYDFITGTTAAALTGKTFGRWSVIKRVPKPVNRKINQAYWLCRCACGAERILRTSKLTGKRGSKSCGCFRSDMQSLRARTHGATRGHVHTPEYKCWTSMMSRCYHPYDKSFERYGGRGIVVCEAWQDFAQFFLDMGCRPSLQHTIERRDVNGPYHPDNCRWATRKEQGYNKRDTVYLTFKGETHCIAEWATRISARAGLLYSRYYAGWTPEDILTKPVLTRRKRSDR
jgi:hypothetical protein